MVAAATAMCVRCVGMCSNYTALALLGLIIKTSSLLKILFIEFEDIEDLYAFIQHMEDVTIMSFQVGFYCRSSIQLLYTDQA